MFQERLEPYLSAYFLPDSVVLSSNSYRRQIHAVYTNPLLLIVVMARALVIVQLWQSALGYEVFPHT